MKNIIKGKHLSNKELKNAYNVAINCITRMERKRTLTEVAYDLNVTYEHLRNSLLRYCNINKLKPIDEEIITKVMNDISELIKEKPENIVGCIREYVATKRPDLTVKGKEKEFTTMVRTISSSWYTTGSKKHVCFMTVSKTGKAIVNGKTTKSVNKEYPNHFFARIKAKIINLFRSSF